MYQKNHRRTGLYQLCQYYTMPGDLDGSNNVRMIMRFTSSVQFGVAADLVEYA